MTTRRQFLAGVAGSGVHLALAVGSVPAVPSRRFLVGQLGEVVRDESFARLERLAEGVWAVVSKPTEGRRTLCNGGLVAGTEGVLAVEGLNTPEGARWLVDAAVELIGRRPTHLALTHYHGDHSRGLPGFRAGDGTTPRIHSTRTTLDLLREADYGQAGEAAAAVLEGAEMLAEDGEPLEIDLGGRSVRVTPRLGHTPSDLSVEVADSGVVFCGDLVWNGMFPNYVDAIPSRLYRHCTELLDSGAAIYVPGHGGLADAEGLRSYLRLLADVGRAAQMAFDEGLDVAEAADTYRPARGLGQWTLFSPDYHEVAFRAWYRELEGAPDET